MFIHHIIMSLLLVVIADPVATATATATAAAAEHEKNVDAWAGQDSTHHPLLYHLHLCHPLPYHIAFLNIHHMPYHPRFIMFHIGFASRLFFPLGIKHQHPPQRYGCRP